MLSDAMKFWESIAGKVKQLIRGETQNAFRCERYEVSTAPNGTVMGVKKPFGSEILLPYSQEVSEASVGDPVLVVWWNSMSNAKVYYYANGYEGTTGGDSGGDEVVIATITFPLSWNDSGSGYYTVTPTISGATASATSKVDLQPTQAQTIQLQSDGVTALYVENNAGVLTAYAIGNAPTTAMTMQCTLTGVTSDEPLDPFRGVIKTATFSSSPFSVAASANGNVSISIGMTGYTPIGIIQILGSGSSGLSYSDVYLESTSSARIYYRNNTTSDKSSVTLRVVVLFISNSIV